MSYSYCKLNCPMKSFDGTVYICDACHKRLFWNEMSSQAVFSKKKLDLTSDELKDFKKLEKK